MSKRPFRGCDELVAEGTDYNLPWMVKILTLAVCVAGLFLRVPDRFLNPQFWAEDGTILFTQAVSGGVRSLIEPYQGALYTFQRVGALIAVQFSWEYAPAIFMAFAWLAFIAIVLWCLSSRVPGSFPVKLILAILMAYSPVKNETFLNLINAHWALSGLGMLLLIMQKPAVNSKQICFDYFMAVLMGVTGPFCLIYFPLFAFKAWLRRGRYYFFLLALVAACGVVQLAQMHSREFKLMGGPLNPSIAQILSVLDQRFLWMFTGYTTVPFRTLSLPLAVLGAATIVLISLAILRDCFKVGGFDTGVPMLACILVCGATFVEYRQMPEALINAARYFFIPIVTYTWSIAFALRSRPILYGPLLLVPLAVFLSHPAWAEYRMKDLNWKEGAACLKTNPLCTVRIHPIDFNFNVFSTVPGRLISAREISDREAELARVSAPASK